MDYEPLGNLGAVARDARTHIYVMPICGQKQPGRLNLKATDLSLGSSWWILGLYEPSKIDCKYFSMYVCLTIFLEKKIVAFY